MYISLSISLVLDIILNSSGVRVGEMKKLLFRATDPGNEKFVCECESVDGTTELDDWLSVFDDECEWLSEVVYECYYDWSYDCDCSYDWESGYVNGWDYYYYYCDEYDYEWSCLYVGY